ncbi:hypothetical protein ACFL15_01930 [Patescibacteria group bacterium]
MSKLCSIGETCRRNLFDLLLSCKDDISSNLDIGLGIVNAKTNTQKLSMETGVKKIEMLENGSNRPLSIITILPKEKIIRVKILERSIRGELHNFLGNTIKSGPNDANLTTFKVEYI